LKTTLSRVSFLAAQGGLAVFRIPTARNRVVVGVGSRESRSPSQPGTLASQTMAFRLAPMISCNCMARVRCSTVRGMTPATTRTLSLWSSRGSEERRVGKECRSRWTADHYKQKDEPARQLEARRKGDIGNKVVASGIGKQASQ